MTDGERRTTKSSQADSHRAAQTNGRHRKICSILLMRHSTSRSTHVQRQKMQSAPSFTQKNKTDSNKTGEMKLYGAIRHMEERSANGFKNARNTEGWPSCWSRQEPTRDGGTHTSTRTQMRMSTSSKGGSSSAAVRVRHRSQAQSSSIRTGASMTVDELLRRKNGNSN